MLSRWLLLSILFFSPFTWASFTLLPIPDDLVQEGEQYQSPYPSVSGTVTGALSFTLLGLDSIYFTLDSSTGKVTLPPKDYENPQDFGLDNTYTVILMAQDFDGVISIISWVVSIEDLPPSVFTIDPVMDDTVDEGQIYQGPAMSVTGVAYGPVSYEAIGVDALNYIVNSKTGHVIMPPRDYEVPQDINGDNTYQIGVLAKDADGNIVDSITWNVSVNNVVDEDSDGDGVNDSVEAAEFTDHFDGTDFIDTDDDGLPDAVDNDADSDGILNTVEDNGINPYGDADIDGVPNYLDADNRGDGGASACIDSDPVDSICDYGKMLDPVFDFDQDGRANHADRDSDSDLLPDGYEGAADADGDSRMNFLDRDSDGDRIPDAIEANVFGGDSDGDQIIDPFDVDTTGGPDFDLDGVNDLAAAQDYDQDGVPNYLDQDSDNDSLPDFFEGGNGKDINTNGIDDQFDALITGAPDNNGDGIGDNLNGVNTDGIGLVDYFSHDSDADGLSDTYESGASGQDLDNDQIDDAFDVDYVAGPDSNGDGIVEIMLPDSDGDGASDFRDLDSDNDTWPDVYESGGLDEDNNALLDAAGVVVSGAVDSDADMLPDYRDTDSNDDMVSDIAGSHYAAFDGDSDGQVDITMDSDLDGIDDSVDSAPTIYGLLPLNTDGDALNDDLDTDDDNDGISDLVEGGLDSDMDGVLDRLDPDSDNDGISDRIEADVPQFIGDTNLNGVDDSLEVIFTGGIDSNSDGFDDAFLPVDTDRDNVADYLDDDSDNDSISDNDEAPAEAPLSIDDDNDGIDNRFDVDITLGTDANHDGIDDSVVPVVDTDNDGIADFRDTNSDNDSIPDKLENEDINNDGINDRLQAEDPVKTGDGAGSISHVLLVLLMLLVLIRHKKLPVKSIMASFLLFLSAGHTYAESEWVCGSYLSWPDKAPEFEDCFYAGAGLGTTTVEPEATGSSWNLDDDASTGFKVFAGYHIWPQWFFEMGYADLGKAALTNVHTLITDKEQIEYSATSLWAGYYLPHEWMPASLPVRPFVKVGLSSITSSSSSALLEIEEKGAAQFSTAAGLDWMFMDHWSLRAEYEAFAADASLMSLSVAYWFGGTDRHYAPPAPEPVAEPEKVVLDSDGDGIPDELDQCASTPVGAEANEDGCAVYQGRLPGVNVRSDSTELTESSFESLDKAIEALKRFAETHIEIQAHTDSRGTQAYNQALSERRAQAVMDYLVKKGIPQERLSIKGFGESKPVADNATEEGRALNRRVEFVVISAGDEANEEKVQ